MTSMLFLFFYLPAQLHSLREREKKRRWPDYRYHLLYSLCMWSKWYHKSMLEMQCKVYINDITVNFSHFYAFFFGWLLATAFCFILGSGNYVMVIHQCRCGMCQRRVQLDVIQNLFQRIRKKTNTKKKTFAVYMVQFRRFYNSYLYLLILLQDAKPQISFMYRYLLLVLYSLTLV